MIELAENQLRFSFPDLHTKAECKIEFQRTLRIPDDNRSYSLPPGLGRFALNHVDDYAEKLPPHWKQHGGVFLPIYQSEALWINFAGWGDYPCAVKIAAGKINAVSGKAWSSELSDDPQDYVVSTSQPWLDGFNVAEGLIRQFVAMPLGEGFTAEEQITDKAEHGGIQLIVYPMKREIYREKIEKPRLEREKEMEDDLMDGPRFMRSECCYVAEEQGLAPGGLMKQKIHEDEYGIDAWDQTISSRCFIHLANSAQYQQITGHLPPEKPPTAQEYTNAGLPWFDYYSDAKALQGSDTLGKLSSAAAKMVEKGKGIMPGNDPVAPTNIKVIKESGAVREGQF